MAMQPVDLGFGRLFVSVHEAVIVADAETGRIHLWNPAAEAIFGYTAAEARGLTLQDLVPLPLQPPHAGGEAGGSAAEYGAIVDADRVIELSARRKSGEPVTVELALSTAEQEPPADAEHGRYAVAIVRDISERAHAATANSERLAERAAREQAEAAERSIVGILERMSDAFFALDPRWRFTYLNAQAERLLGRGRAELIGRVIWDEFPAMRGLALYQEAQSAAVQRSAIQC
jgi:PAS domain S-box-containing protein